MCHQLRHVPKTSQVSSGAPVTHCFLVKREASVFLARLSSQLPPQGYFHFSPDSLFYKHPVCSL